MTTTTVLSPRIDRILAATRELAVQGGVRGITIADIARRADVGKGTLYQYWPTKEDLLADLFAHDFFEVLSEVEAAVREDSALIAPHRLLPLVGSTLERHPFAAAVHSNDRELLGAVAAHPAIAQISGTIGPVAMLRRIFPVLRRNGLVRSDLSLETQVHATAALLHGLHDIGTREPVADLLPGSDPREVLAQACVALLETADQGDPASAAAEALVQLDSARSAALADLRTHGLGKTSAL